MKPKPSVKAAPAKRRRKFRPGRGSLVLIATLFLSAGLIRLGNGVGAALARASEPTATADDAQQECTTDAGTLALLSEIQAREKRLSEREGLLADRDQAVKLAQKQLETRLVELKAAEEELAKTVAIADSAADADVTRLVTLYENMKPKEAAPLFEEMAPDFAAGFLARMRPDTAAAVLAGLDPKTAYSISVIMAGRNANAPTN